MQLYSDFSQLALPVFTLKQETKLEYAQLMRVLMDDPAIVVREFILPIRTYKNREFTLTYTALVAHSRDAVLITGEMLTAELTKLSMLKKGNNI